MDMNLTLKPQYFNPDTVQACKDKVITVDDLELILKAGVFSLYNDLICYFNINGRKLFDSFIFTREIIHDYIEREHAEEWHLFNIIKQNLLTISSRGYVFTENKLSLTDAEHKRLMTLCFEMNITI